MLDTRVDVAVSGVVMAILMASVGDWGHAALLLGVAVWAWAGLR